MVPVFSKRHESAIFDKKIRPSLPGRVRMRLWLLLGKFDFSYRYHPDPNDNWETTTTVLEQVAEELCRRYGTKKLIAFLGDTDEKGPVDLEGFVRRAYPAQVFDVVELFFEELQPSSDRYVFQKELNDVLEEEAVDWRLTDGRFFKVDSEFLATQVIARTYELLKAEGFEGALDEFNEARKDLDAGDSKGAVHNACKSFESVLKSILGRGSGNASVLIRELTTTDFYSTVPQEVGKAFGEQVLMSLPFLRNRLGGHGQGEAVIDVPKHYAELAVNLSACLMVFAIRRSLELQGSSKNEHPDDSSSDPFSAMDDDVPF
jgi:hypothetical protein